MPPKTFCLYFNKNDLETLCYQDIEIMLCNYNVLIMFCYVSKQRINNRISLASSFLYPIGDWGGALGLFFGASLLSFIETMDFCFWSSISRNGEQ